jgi:LysR family nitrogen assimilation transcriptional regulator
VTGSSIEIKQLRYFAHVASAGSLLCAAYELGITQPTLSRNLAALEASVGSVLMVRGSRGVQLTQAGRRLLSHAHQIIHSVDLAIAHVEEAKIDLNGIVTIGVSPAVAPDVVVPVAHKFRVDHPAVRLRIVEGLSRELA